MATFDDVARLALAMPEATERISRGHRQWCIKDLLFVWERPLRKSDLASIAKLGQEAPDGVVLGARVPDETAKFALVASQPDVYFTIPHFNGYPAVLIKLDVIEVPELDEVVTEAWLDRAPAKLTKAFLSED